MKYVSPDGWYSLSYGSQWEFEVEEDCTTFYKTTGGVGALQISAFETGAPRSAKDSLIEYLEREKVSEQVECVVFEKGQQLAVASFTKDDSFTKVFFVSKGTYLLFITYICDLASKTIEIEDINTIIQSLRLADELRE